MVADTSAVARADRAIHADVIKGMITDATLCAALTDALVAAPFAAFYWEASPVAPGDLPRGAMIERSANCQWLERRFRAWTRE